MLNLVGKTDMLSSVVRLLAKLGASDKANARAKLISGLKKLVAEIKINSDAPPPTAEQFNIQTEIIELVNKIADYPDSRSVDLDDSDWNDVSDAAGMVRDYVSTGPYGLMNNLNTLLDILIYAQPNESDTGAMLNLLLAVVTNEDYSANRDLTALLTQDAPTMIRLAAPHGRSLTGVLEGISYPDGFLDWAHDVMRSDYSVHDIIMDTERLLASPQIQAREFDRNSILYSAGLLMRYFGDIQERGRRPDPDGYFFEDHWNENELPYPLFDRLNFVLSQH